MATALHVPLDVFSVRKLGVPGHPELAMGAIASGGVQVLNEDVLAWYRPSADTVDAVARVEMRELDRRERLYREGRPLVLVEGRTVILVDDGLATGSTMRAAVQAVRQLRAGRVVVAAPVGAPDTCEALRRVADDVVCVLTPDRFVAVGAWYRDFSETTDDEVRRLLQDAQAGSLRPVDASRYGATSSRPRTCRPGSGCSPRRRIRRARPCPIRAWRGSRTPASTAR